MFPIEFELEGVPAGSGSLPWAYTHGERHGPYGRVYVCQHSGCGRIWARATTPFGYLTHSRYCEQHGNGTLWIDWNHDYNRAIPLSLLKREFLLTAALTDSGTKSAPVG